MNQKVLYTATMDPGSAIGIIVAISAGAPAIGYAVGIYSAAHAFVKSRATVYCALYYLVLIVPSAAYSVAGIQSFSTPVISCAAVVSGPSIGIIFALTGIRIAQHEVRRKAQLCAKCEYDLRGNTSGICPECGTTIPQKQRCRIAKTNGHVASPDEKL